MPGHPVLERSCPRRPARSVIGQSGWLGGQCGLDSLAANELLSRLRPAGATGCRAACWATSTSIWRSKPAAPTRCLIVSIPLVRGFVWRDPSFGAISACSTAEPTCFGASPPRMRTRKAIVAGTIVNGTRLIAVLARPAHRAILLGFSRDPAASPLPSGTRLPRIRLTSSHPVMHALRRS